MADSGGEIDLVKLVAARESVCLPLQIQLHRYPWLTASEEQLIDLLFGAIQVYKLV